MAFNVWIAFAAATGALMLVPGPTVMLVVSYALGQGRRAAAPTALGVALGDFTAMSLSVLGVGALLAASATLFLALKWIGAAYLVWLGVKLWRSGGAAEVAPRRGGAPMRRMLGHAWLVTALNPKSITFFVAFVPQFLSAERPFWPQVAILVATFVTMGAAAALIWGLAAARAGGLLRAGGAARWAGRAGGTCLIGAGIAAAAQRS